ncbi:DUF871 domain-containing protein [Pseudolactococcus reticulitermitis]|uniref:DUF871 domain-containing protein n=1 Tax=Pseudolactococcus reticulitermitis TaxID=2025039 RepID=A0A224XCH8_9LACT|nr:MupG family TIM beta-alpha barrel fold protein [Lactococcus reticulitermitis]GAX47375.1 hypothetical protein RsY01_975 [Lactococcus reticulitermitis]
MYGFSIFMNTDLNETKRSYLTKMANRGFEGIFTSMHIPEDDVKLYKKRLIDLGGLAKANHLKLMVDISGDALSRSGFSFDNLAELKALGVTGLRMDYHISNATISKASQDITISLNASTITQQDIDELQANHANFDQLEAWHNYYPRPETGMSHDDFIEKNKCLRQHGFKVMAFVPGDADLRHPLYLGLPTLEAHRFLHPLAALMDMERMSVDDIYIGDGGLKEMTARQLSHYIKEQTVLLRGRAETADFSYVLGNHANRQDAARDVIRSATARFKAIPEIRPENTSARHKGAITIDNCDYGRYMGEIQIVKKDLQADSKVNRVGQIIAEDIALLDYIGAGQKFRIENEKQND